MSKKDLNKCANCSHFDNSKHSTDKRTASAGICMLFKEITFLADSCKQHFNFDNSAQDWADILRFTNANETEIQQKLDL